METQRQKPKEKVEELFFDDLMEEGNLDSEDSGELDSENEEMEEGEDES